MRIPRPPRFRPANLFRWRPGLRAIVAIPAVLVVVGMAIVVSNEVASELRQTATASALQNVEAIVRGYVDPALQADSLDLGADVDPAIDAQLERLTISGDIRRIHLWTRDGRIAYSSVASLRGEQLGIGPAQATAFSGASLGRYDASDAMTEAIDGPPLPARVLEIFVPIRGPIDGDPIGVYDVYQDARPIEDRIEATRAIVFVVALVAASLLVGLLFLAFGGASRVLAAQNRRLVEQADAERLLHVDLRRREERFRSLIRNASDVVAVIAEDGTIRYESPAVERVLGYRADDRIGGSLFTAIHRTDRDLLRRRFVDVARTSGAEAHARFRVRHADGTWRTIEGIAKNLRDDPAVDGIVINYRDVTEQTNLEEQLRHQAFHDALTGLANRALFLDRLEHALQRGRRGLRTVAVVFIDLDDFKAANDRLGHAGGDALLRAAAERVRLGTREADTVARLGADEFAVLLEDSDAEEAGLAAARIVAAFRSSFSVEGQAITTRASVGVAVQASTDAVAEDLIRDADLAMNASKSRGGDRATTFEPELHDASVSRMELTVDLQGAIERGEMWLAYQPLVDLVTGRTVGHEALIRWAHPGRGPISPAAFIPLAEESGMILPLGLWALESACRQAVAWQRLPGRADLTISVNVSGRQLDDPGFVADVRAVLADTGLAPGCLTLEITESVFVEDVEPTVVALRQLKVLGVRLAIDDFGTGYSSLSYLRRFPVDILKIDQSFVANLDPGGEAADLLRSIVNLGSSLRLETVAEGIEDADQLDALRRLGAGIGQGFHLAPPMPADEVSRRLAGLPVPAAEPPSPATHRPAPDRLRPARRRTAPSVAALGRLADAPGAAGRVAGP